MSRPAGSAMTCTPWALCLMPLWMSTARERCGSWSDADHDLVDGAGQVSLEAADYFSLRESFSRASSQVVAGGWVPAQAREHGSVERGVSLSLASSVEAQPLGLAG